MKFIKFLIMENLTDDGRYLCIEDLKNNVIFDFFSIKKHADFDIFELALESLSEEQSIFVNKGKKEVAATQYGISKLS